MTRNLIEARAWMNGRKEACSRCQHLGNTDEGFQEYGWRNCQMDDGGDSSKWEGGRCRYFTPKKDSDS